MIELLIYYVLPNILLFGGLWMFGRYIEKSAEYYIHNFEKYEQELLDLKRKFSMLVGR